MQGQVLAAIEASASTAKAAGGEGLEAQVKHLEKALKDLQAQVVDEVKQLKGSTLTRAASVKAATEVDSLTTRVTELEGRAEHSSKRFADLAMLEIKARSLEAAVTAATDAATAARLAAEAVTSEVAVVGEAAAGAGARAEAAELQAAELSGKVQEEQRQVAKTASDVQVRLRCLEGV